jgi:CO dehydrogenase/acetyl-CoA synthase alpha subunit
LISLSTLFSCNVCELQGDNNLGGKFTLLEGDKQEDRIIVYCTTSQGCCDSGIPIIPQNYKTQYGKEFVKDAVYDKNWILVNSYLKAEEIEQYWIIEKNFKLIINNCDNVNCDSIIQSHVYGPFDLNELQSIKSDKGIDLNFDSK